MLDGAMVVVLAVAADIPHVGNCFDSEAVLMKKFAQPGQSPKSAAEFDGLKTLSTSCIFQIGPTPPATRMLSV